MRNIDRELKMREQILLGILAAMIIGAAYYYLVHQPVKEGIAIAQQQISELSAEKQVLDAQIALLEKMAETNEDPTAIALGYMPSYNYSAKEIKLLNDILQDTRDYTVNFSGITRDGDQVRRNFTLSFRVNDYEEADEVIHDLTKTELRCLIGDMKCSTGEDNTVIVDVSATFYETMVEGEADAAIPADQQAAAGQAG